MRLQMMSYCSGSEASPVFAIAATVPSRLASAALRLGAALPQLALRTTAIASRQTCAVRTLGAAVGGAAEPGAG